MKVELHISKLYLHFLSPTPAPVKSLMGYTLFNEFLHALAIVTRQRDRVQDYLTLFDQLTSLSLSSG